METPFESIESAHEYIALLREQVQEVETGILEDITEAQKVGTARQLDALRLVDYKLKQLASHLTITSRLLNDLRALSRLMLRER